MKRNPFPGDVPPAPRRHSGTPVLPGFGAVSVSALRGLPVLSRFVGRGTLLVREGDGLTTLRLVRKGWATRSRSMPDGRRQILGFVLPGDAIGLSATAGQAAAATVATVTACEIVEIDSDAVLRLARTEPDVAQALGRLIHGEAERLGDQVLRLGRMTAYERVGHFLLEIHDRQQSGPHRRRTVDFPITQTVAAEALGLSVVHVNRQVMRLRREGVVVLDRRSLTLGDEARLRAIAGRPGPGGRTPPPVLAAAE